MAAKDYSIDVNKIENNIKEFAFKHSAEITTKPSSNQITYTLVHDKGTSIVNVYLKKNGKTSFSAQGTFPKLAEDCIEYVIERTSLPDD